MKIEAIIKGFDDLSEAKRRSSLAVKLMFCLAVIIVIGSLVLLYTVTINSQNNVRIVDKAGNYLPSTLTNKDKLFQVLLKNHCANTAYFANSFDRLTIKENQARTVFLCNRTDAMRIFANFNTRGAYADALNRGVIYRTQFLHLDEFSGDREPYHVRFTSLLQIVDNDRPTAEFEIGSEGEIITHTPQYPENTSGLYFIKYSQTFQKRVKDE